MKESADIGVIGLAVMGENLILNMESKGFRVAVHNRTVEKVDAFTSGRAKGKNIIGCKSLEALCSHVKTPRKIMLMIKAGPAVDSQIDALLPFLEEGDIIIDGGNSHFPDTSRRVNALKEKGIRFVGSGVSGGEEGALKGPSLMPGGSESAWPEIKSIFQGIAAKVEDRSPCCDWVGPEGAGHFVKMVHNGIEYGDMQLICEAYHLLKGFLGLSNEEIAEVFQDWNRGELNSYLIEITAEIFRKKDDLNTSGAEAGHLIDKILDTAGQKGTGKWTAIVALNHGMPVTLIGEAVFARSLSALKEAREEAAGLLGSAPKPFTGDKAALKQIIENIRQALYASKIVSYAQGFTLLKSTEEEFGWKLNYGGVALMWRGGCIIRSKFLENIKEAFDEKPHLSNLLLSPYFQKIMKNSETGWREMLSQAIKAGIPLPAMSSALAYFDGIRSARLPANLLQAQRDYFGAHTYERTDKPRGEYFHTNWTGRGGDTASSSYNA